MSASTILLRATKLIVAVCIGGLAVVVACNRIVNSQAAGLAHHGLVVGGVRDVAIVPGSFVSRGRPGGILRARLESARWALERGHVRAILVSGDEAHGEATVMRLWLEHSGVDPSLILVDPNGTRTIETMRNAVTRFGIATAVICTQETSMDRALFLARQSGMDAVGLTADVDLPHTLNWTGREALKSTLAVVESTLR